ncbi:Do family serine endopeptidase [bacterium]|nr:Do family serine endopeptidase [bacterium]
MTLRTWKQYGAGLACGVALTAALAIWGPQQNAVAVSSVSDALEVSTVFRDVASRTMPSIVSIETTTRPRQMEMGNAPLNDEALPFREFFRNDPRFREMFENPRRMMTPRRRGEGSGFIIDPSGIIMTNNHVVQGADEIRVRLHDGREFVATEVKTDPRTDVAIVRIDTKDPLPALKLGDSRKMQVGDWVLAFGTPFGLEMTVTQGIISGTSRHRGLAEREDFLQTDAAINPGNSGGPLVNLYGEVIGINTAIASASGGYDGIGFAVPTHIAQWVGDQLIKNGEVKRGYLGTGIAAVDATTAAQFNVPVREGVIVKSVMPDSPADKAGLEPGDVILSLNGEKVANPPALQGVVEQLQIGKSYDLNVVRNGKNETLKVQIDAMPAKFMAQSDDSQSTSPETKSQFDNLGLQLDSLTPGLAKQLGLTNSRGVIVTEVSEDGVAAAAGVSNGDIIERVGTTSVNTVEEFEAAVKSLSLKEGIVLHLRNQDGKRYVILKQQNE